jgi:hypothetical protein
VRQQQYIDKCNPDLDLYGIFGSADEGFDLLVLLMHPVKVVSACLKGRSQGEQASIQKDLLEFDPYHGRFVERCPGMQSGSLEFNGTFEISCNCCVGSLRIWSILQLRECTQAGIGFCCYCKISLPYCLKSLFFSWKIIQEGCVLALNNEI